MTGIAGLHHVTALCTDPQANLAFYTATLGQRLVKRTVNFDAPDTWHLYYGDRTGTPGTVMTFFAFLDAGPGRARAWPALLPMPRALRASTPRWTASRLPPWISMAPPSGSASGC